MDINELFITHNNGEKFEDICLDAIKLANKFKLDQLNKPLVNYKEQKDIKKQIFEKFPENSTDLKELLNEYKEKILDGSVNWSSPNFLAFPDSNNSMAGTVGHILQGMTSQNLCNSLHISPTATIVEIQIIKWLREAIGYESKKKIDDVLDIGGIYTPGGVLSNTIGLLLAREKKFQETMKKGIKFDVSKVKIFMPENIGHYSSKCAAGWLGLGLNSIKLVKNSNNFCFDLEELRKEITLSINNNEIPLAIIGYAGDSRTMTVDNLEELSKIAKEKNIWLHIDACHGSALAFSKKYKHLIKGINLADSVTLDPHKIFWMPYNLSYILIKNPEDFKLISGSSDLITNESLSLGQISPFLGSWGFHGLKLWFIFKNMGFNRLSEFIDNRTDIAKNISDKIAKMEDFYVFNEVVINSITFMYIPKKEIELIKKGDLKTLKKINELNKRIRERLFLNESIFIHTFPLKDLKNKINKKIDGEFQLLRIIISNPLFDEKKAEEVLSKIQDTAKKEYEYGKTN